LESLLTGEKLKLIELSFMNNGRFIDDFFNLIERYSYSIKESQDPKDKSILSDASHKFMMILSQLKKVND
jgi:hypothetical protein